MSQVRIVKSSATPAIYAQRPTVALGVPMDGGGGGGVAPAYAFCSVLGTISDIFLGTSFALLPVFDASHGPGDASGDIASEATIERADNTITVHSAGTYRISGRFRFVPSAMVLDPSLAIAVNGTPQTASQIKIARDAYGAEFELALDILLTLADGDTVAMHGKGEFAGGNTTPKYASLLVQKVGS